MIKHFLSTSLALLSFASQAQNVCVAEPDPRWSDIYETCATVAVSVKTMYNRTISGGMFVTHYKPKGDGPFPLVIMNHGRSADNRASPPRQRYPDIARFWLKRGYAVFVPTRLGYGATVVDGDPEDSGKCDNKNYFPMMDAASEQVRAAIEFGKTLPWVNTQRVIVMGQSVGGFTSVAVSSKRIPGVVAAINFAGGSGGDPKNRPNNPCEPNKIAQTMASFGKNSSVPMLWFYALNDLYWGADHPKAWHKAYVSAGGKAEFVQLPISGDDGHSAISREMAIWQPKIDEWLKTIP